MPIKMFLCFVQTAVYSWCLVLNFIQHYINSNLRKFMSSRYIMKHDDNKYNVQIEFNIFDTSVIQIHVTS